MGIFDLTGRVAVITGGNGGIGLGIAQALAAAGCDVSIWGRNAEKNKNGQVFEEQSVHDSDPQMVSLAVPHP